MSWIKMQMKFPGKCVICKGDLKKGDLGLWAKNQGVKHLECSESESIPCAICGGPAGCEICEFADICDIPNISPKCVCSKCVDTDDPLHSYQRAVGNRSTALKL